MQLKTVWEFMLGIHLVIINAEVRIVEHAKDIQFHKLQKLLKTYSKSPVGNLDVFIYT